MIIAVMYCPCSANMYAILILEFPLFIFIGTCLLLYIEFHPLQTHCPILLFASCRLFGLDFFLFSFFFFPRFSYGQNLSLEVNKIVLTHLIY